MRFSLLLLTAAAAGLAAAQNVTPGPSQDIGQCIVVCGEKAIQDHPDVNKCSGISDQTKQTQCICRSDALVSELGTCMTSTCPTLLAGIDVGQRLHQTCDELNAAPALAGGLLPVVAAASALVVGTFLF